jgi:hypothetical protein
MPELIFHIPFSKTLCGNFVVRLNAETAKQKLIMPGSTFSLSAPSFRINKEIYMFNNYNLEPEFMMDYNAKKGIYEKAL